MVKVFLSKNPAETRKIGRDLAKKTKKAGPSKKACLLALKGDLGGGKTTFLQGFAKGLGIEEKILSPTFVIMKKFKIPGSPVTKKNKEFKYFYHLDCYRLEDAQEVLDLGFSEILFCPDNLVAVEWSEKIKKALPKNLISAEFKFVDDKKRKITIKNG